MPVVHLSSSKRLRFPARNEDFAHGVEIGVVAVLMDMPLRDFTRKLSASNLDQVKALADKMGYRLEERTLDEHWVEVTFSLVPAQPRAARQPHLTLVHSA
jgi:hypothetical protein